MSVWRHNMSFDATCYSAIVNWLLYFGRWGLRELFFVENLTLLRFFTSHSNLMSFWHIPSILKYSGYCCGYSVTLMWIIICFDTFKYFKVFCKSEVFSSCLSLFIVNHSVLTLFNDSEEVFWVFLLFCLFSKPMYVCGEDEALEILQSSVNRSVLTCRGSTSFEDGVKQ